MLECPVCQARHDDGARFCSACGSPLRAATGSRRREQRKTVTAVFTDLVGSTELAGRLDPEALRALMGRYYDVMRAEVERHGGRVDKFIGDAVVAFFGVPVAHEDDALRAVRAAAGMRAALDRLNHELVARFGTSLRTRTGVNTGDVLAGDAAQPDAFTVGDPVNVAARLEQSAAPGEVLLGEDTYRLVRHATTAEELAPLAVKGKERPLIAYRLVEVAEHAPSRPRRLDSPLVGREHELRLAVEAFERAGRDRACHLITILGTAGAGKSRLAVEVVSTLEARATVFHGRCLPYGEGITFWPLAEILRGAAGIVNGDDAEKIVDKLAKLVDGEEDAGLISVRLAQITGSGVGTAAADEIFWAARKFLEAAARRRPVLVVVDDIHWAEPTMLDLLDHVVEWARNAPIMILGIARPELLDARPGWARGRANATTMHLEPLSDDECGALMENLLDGSELPADVRDRITEGAEGIPLFVEEMLGMLVDSGLLHHTGHGWVAAGDLGALSVPPTIRALLAARLDGLADDERRILEAAAVVGKEFWRGAVTAVAPAELRPRVAQLLTELLRKDLVVSERSTVRGEDAYRFRHILIRDAAYEALPKVERSAMHEEFAAWLGAAGQRTGEVEEILGYHLQEAYRNRTALGPPDEAARNLAERAAAHLSAAGRRAFNRNDYRGAVNLLERAQALSERPGAELMLAYGSALANRGSLKHGLEVLSSAIESAEHSGDERLVWTARIEEIRWRAQVETGAGVAAEILDLVPRSIPLFEAAGDDTGAARAWMTIATAHNNLGQHELALAAAERALDHASRAGDDGLVLGAYRLIGVAVIWGPVPLSEATARYGDLIDRLRGGPLQRVAATEVVASLKTQLGQVSEARALIARVRELYDELGNRLAGAKTALIEHRGPLGDGDFVTAEAILSEACEILEASGERSWYSTAVAVQATALYELGRLEEAYRATEKSEAAGSEDDAVTQAYWRAERAKVLARWGRGDEAITLAGAAVAVIDRTDGLLEQADVYAALAEVKSVLGRRDEARWALLESLRRYEAKGAEPFAARVRARLDPAG